MDDIGAVLVAVSGVLAVLLLTAAFCLRKKAPQSAKLLTVLGVLFAMLPALVLFWWLAALENDPYR